MPGVFLYLTACSIRNRIRVRLRRLKEPRYLLGLIAGVVYLYAMVFRHAMSATGPSSSPRVMTILDQSRAPLEFIGVTTLFVAAAAAWVMPGGVRPRPIEFTRAEVQFLFQAPISRRQLLHYKLLRGQVGGLFSSAIATMFLRPRSLAAAWPLMVGMWVMLAIVRLYFTGAALRQQSLVQHGTTGAARQWVPIGVVTAAVLVLVVTVVLDWPALTALTSGGAVFGELRRLAATGAAQWVLWPFRAAVRLPMSGSPAAFLRAAPSAFALLLLNYVWVLRSDASFGEASAAYAEKRALDQASGAVRRSPNVTAAPFTLAISGRPETAILWKNLIGISRYASRRVLVRVVPLVLLLGAIFSHNRGSGGMTELIAVVSLLAAALTVLVGPQIVRHDLRQDLASLAVLKSWPVRGAAVIRGELLAPAVVLTVVVWLLIVTAACFVGRPGSSDELIIAAPVTYATGAMVIAPSLILAQLVLQNGIAVVFPAWVAVGTSRARGIDAIGQRLLMMAGIILTLVVALLPAVMTAGVLGLAIYMATHTIPVVAPAIVVAAVVIAECWVATELLGRVFERTDVSAVEPVE